MSGRPPRTCCVRGAGPTTSKLVLGGVLLSHTLAGAVPSALSGLASGFGMDAGRLPAAMTTETTEQAARNDRRLWCGYSIIHAQPPTHTTLDVWPGGWVGCGPYSGRSRYCGCPPLSPHAVCVCCVWGVVVCIGLLVPVSSINRYQSSTPGLSTQSSTGSLPEHQKCPAETSS